MIDCWLPRRHPYRAALQRLGFIDRADARRLLPPDPGVGRGPRADGGPEGLDLHYTLGDTDLV